MVTKVVCLLIWCALLLLAPQTEFAQTKRTSGFATINNGRIYYETAGRGKPIVFVHGGLVDSRLWDEQFSEFSKKYRVVRYDIRGHGRSPLPAAPYSLVEDLDELLKFLKIERATVVGLSLGGIIAADFALEYPGRIESLVLVGAGLRGFESKPDEVGKTIFQKVRSSTADQIAALWLEEHQFFAGLKDKPRQRALMRQMLVDNHQALAKIEHAKIYQSPEPATIQRLSNITAPTLVVVGGSDHPNLTAIAKTLQKKIPNAELVTISGASHHPNFENPTEFNRILEQFLREKI